MKYINLMTSFRALVGFLLSIALLSVTSNVFAAAVLEGTKPAQWRIVWKSNPDTQATVCWSTKEAGNKHALIIGVRGEEKTKTVEAQVNGTYKENFLYYHQVELKDLTPGTAYDIQMVSDDEKSEVFFFRTAPDKDRDFSIIFGGDSRSDPKTRREVNQMIAELVLKGTKDNELDNDILAFAHGGDYIGSGKSLDQWTQWMSDHELTTTKEGQILPIIAARGNHDGGPLFNQIFAFPEDDKNYYTTKISDQLTFITLNTETTIPGDQSKWLSNELSKGRKESRWLLAQYHKPAYPAVKSPSSALRFWVPLFEKYNVDLACEADGHNIKRTVPIRNNKEDPSGVVYIGEGGLGVGQRTPKTDRWYLKKPGMAGKAHHVQLLTFTKEQLEYRCILLEERKVHDTYILKPRK